MRKAYSLNTFVLIKYVWLYNKFSSLIKLFSRITNIFRRKGVVRDWFGNGVETSVSGKIEFFQQTEYEATDVEFSVGGLTDAGVYHIHRVVIINNFYIYYL